MIDIEVIAQAFTFLCFAQAGLSVLIAVTTNLRFLTYLKENHYQKWCEFLGEDLGTIFKHIYLTPMSSRKSYFYFLFRSQEDFGDARVREYRRKVNWAVYGFAVGVIAAFMSLVISAVIPSMITS